MLDLTFVRSNLELVEEKLRARGADPAVLLGDFRALDASRREAITTAERLKARLGRARDKRVPLYLSRDELLSICRWKLRDQYSRAARLLESSSEKRVKRTTQMAFACKDKDAGFELAGRLDHAAVEIRRRP